MMIKQINYYFMLFLCLIILTSCKMDEEQLKQIYSTAIAKANEKDFEAAIDIIEKNIEKRDRGFVFYFYRGFFKEQLDVNRNASIAINDYLKAYSIDPDRYVINSIIGDAYNTMDEYEKAIPFLERANELYVPESGAPSPYWALAEAYLHMGRLEEALEMNSKALEEGDYSWHYLQRGIILSMSGDVQSLVENYEIAKEIELRENDESSLVTLNRDYALQLIKINYIDKAYQLYNDWLKGNEDYYEWCYADIGYIYLLKGELDKSIEMLKKAESIDNTQVFTLQYLSFYYYLKEDYDKAYGYEASSRTQKEPLGVIVYWKKSKDEFLEGYKTNWQFQKLLDVNNNAEGSKN